MSEETDPGTLAQLDQMFAEADEKYAQLVEILRKSSEEHGIYGAMAIMGKSLDIASQQTLISIVLTGMRREIRHGENDSA